MIDKKIGLIGYGNMGGAILNGVITAEVVKPSMIYVSDTNIERLNTDSKKLSFNASTNNEIATMCDIIILAVKPNVIEQVLTEITIKDSSLIVSIAAGVTISTLQQLIGDKKRIIRLMPNTPAQVLAGMTSISPNPFATDEDIETVSQMFEALGKVVILPEDKIHAVIGVSGSAPAYIFQIIEAMSDAGVLAGLSRDEAITLSAQTVLGSAKMVLESGMHPAELKDMVTSPSGTTIDGVYAMEQSGVRAGIMNAVIASVEKSKKMSK